MTLHRKPLATFGDTRCPTCATGIAWGDAPQCERCADAGIPIPPPVEPPVPPKPQPEASGMLRALERAYAAIRRGHPDVPEAVIVIGVGSSARKGIEKWGHHAPNRWQWGEERVHEILISGEGLNRGAAEVLTTLIHEAAHGLARARRIKDTSRDGRMHSMKFVALAEELGLLGPVARDPKNGYSACVLSPATEQRYEPELAALTAALRLYRHKEVAGAKEARDSNNNGVRAYCECGRSFRISAAVLAQADITCAACGEPFRAREADGE